MAKAARRRKEKNSKATDGNNNDDGHHANAPTSSPPVERREKKSKAKTRDEMTTWEILTEHPLVKVGKFILIPYLAYVGYYFFRLQHPEYVSKATAGILSLRPSVGIRDKRQLLIVASPSTGTVQMQKELKDKLGLEIGHETSDTAWHFVRDGTVSWFHGIRFLTGPKSNKEMVNSFNAICGGSGNYTKNMGFHPAAYRTPENKCSYRSMWNDCWRKECYSTLLKEWGCGTRDNCEINFKKTLHQVRNPMRSIESLAVKFCVNGLDSGVVQDAFLVYAGAMFPQHDFHGYSCIEATGYFLVEYQNAMIEARKRGEISDFYKIEETTACEVAELAGLHSTHTTIYEPNQKRIARICDKTKANAAKIPAQQIVEHKENKLNENMVRLGWKDLRGGMHASKKKLGDTDLEMKVKNLFRDLGYDASKIEEEVEQPKSKANGDGEL